MLVLLFLAGSAKTQDRRWIRFSALWLAAYGLLLSTWEPATLCYRMTDIIPLGILFALGLKSWRVPNQILLASVFLASTLSVNLATRILPMHDASRNSTYQDTLSLSKISSPNSLYITPGGAPWIYLLYFTGRTAWNANTYDPGRLADEINRQKKQHSVYRLEGTTWKKVS